MSEMVERVARALHQRYEQRATSRAISGPYIPDTWEQLSPGRQRDFLADARAAIPAMREPTQQQLVSVCDPRNDACRQAYADDWRAMIDAAIGSSE